MQPSDRPQRPPLSSTYCPFCEERYGLPLFQEQATTGNTFSLTNLLPAGTIVVTVHDTKPPCPNASRNHAWHSVLIRRNLSVDTIFRELAFLVKHRFLRATCRLGTSGRIIFVRIYLIPNDLPNTYGELHNRGKIVASEAKRHMQKIIPLIKRNDGLWDADEACISAPVVHLLPSHIDNRSMAEIYNDLPSPVLSPITNGDTTLTHRVASGDSIWGLKTTLYGYQRHSVAVMIDRELSTSLVLDPLYIPVSCMSGTLFYIQPSTMTVLRECPLFSRRSGILCEELGTGKTVMIIALVLATASQRADPKESMEKKHLVMTPLAYRYFPSLEHARKRAGMDRRAIQRIPSLVELLIHHFSSLNSTTGRPAFANELEATHLWPLIHANKAFYHHYDADDINPQGKSKRSTRRAAPKSSPRTLYLSSATLVIVPLTLLGQWKTEIDKHCHDCVRYLVVRPSMDLPDARKLASDYELIIISDTRFRKESNRNKTENLYNLKPCTCPRLVGSRVPDCHCPGDPKVTPLLQVRWKRLVIDEGHTAGNVAGTVNHFVRQLSIQHKWIVTGTPTSNILGLQFGRATDEQDSDIGHAHADVVTTSPSRSEDAHVRIWSDYDRLNLRKLGAMIGDFLGISPFSDISSYFTDHVTSSLCDQLGPRTGAISVLNQVMQMVMVRHRIEDVESDVLLPPMRHDIIYMDLDSHAVKSYNAMQAGLAINAIDSEREGTDYLFHPSKAKDLQTTINNSSQGLFWSASDILYNVDQICELADDYVARAVGRPKIGPEDFGLLQQALKHASDAAKDPIWRAMQPCVDVPFKISGLDPVVFQAWTRTGLCDSSRAIEVMHADRLVILRSLVRKKPLISRDELVKEGMIVGWDEMTSKSVGRRDTKHGINQTKEMAKAVKGTVEALKKRVEEINLSDEEMGERQNRDENRVIQTTEAPATCTTSSSPLSGVKIGPSLSTKLNYILSEVQQHAQHEKFLIFSNSLLTLSQIGEALLLFEIKFLRYTNQEEYLLRQQCLLTFETSDVYRVLLTELKLGARGLNLISASRIIFCEPVWHPDVESQAIKRAHRIGQTKPVTVKTLVIRSTAEEAMVARRQYLRNSDKVPNMTTESGMRQYLQHPRFLAEPVSSDPTVDISLWLDNNQGALDDMQPNSFGDEGCSDKIEVESDANSIVSDARACKRARFKE